MSNSGTLYIVGTPIGNLGDVTLRSLETLKSVDIIACEDTRHTLKLLNYYEIKRPLISYYKQKEQEGSEKIISLLQEGKNIALVSDAGMPCISDPGATLVAKARENGIKVSVVPTATAMASAMAISGIEQPVFTFMGFLSEKKKDNEILLNKFKNVPTSLIFYCSPHDINKNLKVFYSVFGDRKVHIIKELTKIHESAIIDNLSTAKVDEPKGEYVVIIEKGEEIVEEKPKPYDALLKLIESGEDKKEAIKKIAKMYNLPKNTVYQMLIDD